MPVRIAAYSMNTTAWKACSRPRIR